MWLGPPPPSATMDMKAKFKIELVGATFVSWNQDGVLGSCTIMQGETVNHCCN